jgi:hypothetical protein
MDLDYQYVLITCTVGKIRFGALELSAGESVWITSDTTLTPPSPAPTYILEGTSIPLVGGDGDQSGSPPAFLGGTLAVQALCVDPVDGFAGVSFSAKIAWSEEAAYHVLYGRMVECYDELPPEDPGDCLDCDGTPTPAPDTVYLTISNFDGGGAVDANGTTINYDGTYAFDLAPSVTECARYLGNLAVFPINGFNLGGSPGPAGGFQVIAPSGASFAVPANKTAGDGGGYMYFAVFHQFAAGTFNEMACGGDPVTGSVSGEWKTIGQGDSGYDISFDWELSL